MDPEHSLAGVTPILTAEARARQHRDLGAWLRTWDKRRRRKLARMSPRERQYERALRRVRAQYDDLEYVDDNGIEWQVRDPRLEAHERRVERRFRCAPSAAPPQRASHPQTRRRGAGRPAGPRRRSTSRAGPGGVDPDLADLGDDDQPPRPRLAPVSPPPARYTFARLAAAERGEVAAT
jgi:hypothetical protein